MITELPDFVAENPDWWLERINFHFKNWGIAPRSTIEEAYEAVKTELPCTGSQGFRPCANCNELKLPCGRREAPHLSGHNSALGKPLEDVMTYPDGRQVITLHPLEEGDYDPRKHTCPYCKMHLGYEGDDKPCGLCGRLGFL